jgi:chromosome segregation ATPase
MTARVHVHPAVIATNEQLRAEVERLRTLAELNAEQAKLNADTIAEQQRHYDEVLTRLHREYQKKLAEKNEEIEAIKRGVTTIVKQRNDAEQNVRDLESKIVKTSNGWLTIAQIVEQRIYRDACPTCKTIQCEGCVVGYGDSLREIGNDRVVERWSRDWEARIK